MEKIVKREVNKGYEATAATIKVFVRSDTWQWAKDTV